MRRIGAKLKVEAGFNLASRAELRDGLGGVVAWLDRSRLCVWLAAFLVFELCIGVGEFLTARGAFGNATAFLGGVGSVGAASLLLRHKLRPTATRRHAPVSGSGCGQKSGRRGQTVAGLATVTGAGLAAIYIQLLFSLPQAVSTDSSLYFKISEGLLGRTPLDLGHFTYGYPLVIALTRLVADHLISIIVLQHVLRLAAAVLVYVVLRSSSHLTALLAAVLIAVDPFTTYLSQLLLTEGMYTALLLLAVLMAFALVRPGQRHPRLLGFGLGCLTAWVSLLRAAGLLLVAPIMLYVVLSSRSIGRVVPVAVAFASSVAVLSGIQWVLLDDFWFGTRQEASYAFPYAYHRLFDPNNGPIADEARTYVSDDCFFRFTDDRTLLHLNGYFPHQLHECIITGASQAGVEALSTRQLYFEGIRANGWRFVASYLDEVRHFITHGDRARSISDSNVPLPFDTLRPGQCTQLILSQGFRDYACHDFSLPGAWIEQRTMVGLGALFMDVMEPYRLQGLGEWPRLWAALLLASFVLVEGSARVRSIVSLCLLCIGYHAAVISFAQWTLPRYVISLSPFFLIITAAALSILAEEFGWLRTAVSERVIEGDILQTVLARARRASRPTRRDLAT